MVEQFEKEEKENPNWAIFKKNLQILK